MEHQAAAAALLVVWETQSLRAQTVRGWRLEHV
jgi:hypothetical protein